MDIPCIDPRDLMVSPVQKGSTDFEMDFNSTYFDRNYSNPLPLDPQLPTFAGPNLDIQPGDVHLLGFGQENLNQSYAPMEFPYAYDQSNQLQGFLTNEKTAQSAQQTIGTEPCFMNMPAVLHEEYQAFNEDIQSSVAQSVPTTAEVVVQYPVTSSLSTSNDFTPPPPHTITPKPVSSSSSKKRPLKTAADRSAGSRKRQLPCKLSHVPAFAKGKKTESGAAASQRNVSTNDRTSEIKALRAHTVKIEEAMSLIQESVKPFSAFSQRKAAHLIRQGAELVKELSRLAAEEENYGDGSSDEDEISQPSSTISSRYSMSSSDLIDSESVTDNTSVSSTTHQAPVEDKEVISVDDKENRDGHSPCVQCGIKPLCYCTRDNCNYSTHTPAEWRRHEESKKHSQQQGFMCLECLMSPPPVGLNGNAQCEYCDGPLPGNNPNVHYLQCAAAHRTGKTYGRKDRLTAHLRDHHNITTDASSIASNGKYTVDSNWPRQCGFCGKHFVTWDERMDHIATHFQQGKDMSSWKLPFPRPKDFRPGFESHKGNDSDSDDDMDDNSGGPRSRQPSNRDQKSSTSISSSQQNNSSGNQTNGNQGNSWQRGQTSHSILNNDEAPVISNSPRHQKPSVALQRYLSDTDEAIPTVLNLERHRSFITQNPAARDDIVDPHLQRFLPEPPQPLFSSSPFDAGLVSPYKPLLPASPFSWPTTAKPEVHLAKQATVHSYFGPRRVHDVLERPEPLQSIPRASLIEDPIHYAAYKIRWSGAIEEKMEQGDIIEQIKKLDQGPQTIADKKATLSCTQRRQLSIRPPAPPATGFERHLRDPYLKRSPPTIGTMHLDYLPERPEREARRPSEYVDHAPDLATLKSETPNPRDTCHLCIRTTVRKFAFAAHLVLQSVLASRGVIDQGFDAMTMSSQNELSWKWTSWNDHDLRELADTLKGIASLSSVEYDVSEPTVSHFEELWRKKLNYRPTPRLTGNPSYFEMPTLSLDHLRDFHKEDLKIHLGQKVVEIKKKKEEQESLRSTLFSWRRGFGIRRSLGEVSRGFYSAVTADFDRTYGPLSRDSGSRQSTSPWENRYKLAREDERPHTAGRPVSYSQASRPPISNSSSFGDGDKVYELESYRIGDRGKFGRPRQPPWELPPTLLSAPDYFAPSSLYAPPAKARNRSLEPPNLHGSSGQTSYYSDPILANSKNTIENSWSSAPQSPAAGHPSILTPRAPSSRPPPPLTSAKTLVVYDCGSHYEQERNLAHGYAVKGPDIPYHEISPLHGLRTRRHQTVDSSSAKLQLWNGNNSSQVPITDISGLSFIRLSGHSDESYGSRTHQNDPGKQKVGGPWQLETDLVNSLGNSSRKRAFKGDDPTEHFLELGIRNTLLENPYKTRVRSMSMSRHKNGVQDFCTKIDRMRSGSLQDLARPNFHNRLIGISSSSPGQESIDFSIRSSNSRFSLSIPIGRFRPRNDEMIDNNFESLRWMSHDERGPSDGTSRSSTQDGVRTQLPTVTFLGPLRGDKNSFSAEARLEQLWITSLVDSPQEQLDFATSLLFATPSEHNKRRPTNSTPY